MKEYKVSYLYRLGYKMETGVEVVKTSLNPYKLYDLRLLELYLCNKNHYDAVIITDVLEG